MEDDNKPIHERRFNAAVKVIQSLPPNGSFQPSNEMMLKFYSYFKQATQGPCNIPRPSFWDPVGKVKWDAWYALGDMPRDDAMVAYVEDLKLILESMPMTDQVEQLLQVLGPFYEVVEEKKKITHVSDLNTGLGSFGVTAPSKAVTKSIIRTMQMNGTLDGHVPNDGIKQIEEREDGGADDSGDDDDDDDDETEEEVEQRKKASAPKRKSPGNAENLPNGSIGTTLVSMANGETGSKSALNGQNWAEERGGVSQNGGLQHITGHTGDDGALVPLHVTSDSDSEVYCDSMDQFGVDEHGCEVRDSLSGSPSTLSSVGEPHPADLDPEGLLGAQDGIRRGGEDGQASHSGAPRQGLGAGRTSNAAVRRGRGSRSPGSGSGDAGPLQGGGGDGERWRSNEGVARDLNEQIVMALARLQDDMQSVLERLHTLEVLTASQARSLPSEYQLTPANKQKKHFWWPLDMSPTTVALAVVWPFIAHWLIRLYFQRRRRRTH